MGFLSYQEGYHLWRHGWCVWHPPWEARLVVWPVGLSFFKLCCTYDVWCVANNVCIVKVKVSGWYPRCIPLLRKFPLDSIAPHCAGCRSTQKTAKFLYIGVGGPASTKIDQVSRSTSQWLGMTRASLCQKLLISRAPEHQQLHGTTRTFIVASVAVINLPGGEPGPGPLPLGLLHRYFGGIMALTPAQKAPLPQPLINHDQMIGRC